MNETLLATIKTDPDYEVLVSECKGCAGLVAEELAADLLFTYTDFTAEDVADLVDIAFTEANQGA